MKTESFKMSEINIFFTRHKKYDLDHQKDIKILKQSTKVTKLTVELTYSTAYPSLLNVLHLGQI